MPVPTIETWVLVFLLTFPSHSLAVNTRPRNAASMRRCINPSSGG